MVQKRPLGIRKPSLLISGYLELATEERGIRVVSEDDLIYWFVFLYSHLNGKVISIFYQPLASNRKISSYIIFGSISMMNTKYE